MSELDPIEMCANCCRALDRCRIVPVPVELKATFEVN